MSEETPIYSKFQRGDRVRKVGGSYQAEGTIVGVALTTQNQVRYVFEFDVFPGMLHIFNGEQLEYIWPSQLDHG